VARALIPIGAIFAAAQLLRWPRTNPPVQSDLAAPPAVREIVRRACYDCHSNETRWSWYSGIAPASWWIYREVSEGRRRLNFSDWADYAYDPGTKAHKLDQIAEMVTSGHMAPWYYRMAHPQARLSKAERQSIVRWVAQENSNIEPPHQ
jgi:Haem-binding domain